MKTGFSWFLSLDFFILLLDVGKELVMLVEVAILALFLPIVTS
jgi:hypothetical protein